MSQKIKTSVEIDGSLTANSIVKSGGTASQILAADGSVVTAGSGVTISGGTISASGSAGVLSFNTRTGAVTLTSGDVTTALGYTPYNASNPAGYISSYTETDTLASVTGRGASTSTLSTFDGGLNIGNAKLRWGGTTSPTLGFPFTGGPNAFWIDINDGDTGGLAIDNDGTTIYGAGDSGHVFRVIDEDVYQATSNVDASTTFRIQQGQNGGGYVRGNFEITGTLSASGYNKTNWDTAYGWGNHASAGYALSGHTHDLGRYSLRAPALIDSVTASNFRTQLFGSSTGGYNISTARFDSTPGLLSGLNNYGTMMAWSGSDTHGFLAIDYAGPAAIIGGGNADNINWTKRLAFLDDTVPTSRTITINGTSYDLSANRSWTVTGTETDTLATVTGRGSATSTRPSFDGGITVNGQSYVTANGYFVSGAQGFRWNDSSGNYNNVIMRDNGTTWFRNYLETPDSMRAPVFYDSNNTGYYCDPASTSNFNAANFAGSVNLFGGYGPGSGPGLGFENQNSFIRLAFWGMDFYDWNHGTQMVIDNGYVLANNSMRSPTFYDSNDTAYYGDFASTSNFRNLLLNNQTTINTTTPGLTSYGLTFMGGNSDQANGMTWTWGNTNAQAGIYVQSSGAYGTKMYFATTDSFATGAKTAMAIDHVGNVSLNRGTFSTGSVWINNGVNYNSYNENIRLFNATNGVSVIAFGASGTSGIPQSSILGFSDRLEIRVGANGTAVQRNYDNYVEAMGSSRAPIFYDSNNTGYYVDGASTSKLNALTLSSLASDDGMIENNTGGYFHLGGWGVGRTAATAVLVNTAYRADIADNATNADTVDGYHGDTFYRNLGFGSGYPSWNLNTVDPDRSGFTYSNGGPWTGPFIHIGASGYGLQFNASYSSNGDGISYRTRNGDTGNWNSWHRIYSDSYKPNADKVNGYGGYDHVGTGLRPFYNWGGSNGGASAPSGSSYTTGISVGSHPSDPAYGFQIANNMWNVGLWTRNYNSGFGYWVRLLDSENFSSYNNYGSQGLTAAWFNDSNDTSRYVDPTYTGDSIRVSGDIVAYYSDERLKDRKGNIENALDKVLSLNGFHYTPNARAQELGYKYKEEIGVSAQEVEAILPEIIKDAPIGHGYKTLNYGKLTPLLIEAIKEQQTQIEELKELVNKLINK